MLKYAQSIELLTNAEMAEADRLTIAGGTPGSLLMEQAGAAVASEAARLAARHGRIAVFCGPGNNGGDGFVAARLLARQGFAIDLGLLGTREGLRGDAALAARSWTGAVHAIKDVDLDAADLASTRSSAPALPALSMDRPKLRFCDSMHGRS